MKTLQEDIDDLDRMVDTEAQKDAVRSQIRLISREVAALEADYARLAEAHQKLQAAKAKIDKQAAKLKREKAKLKSHLETATLQYVVERQRKSTRFIPRRL